MFTKIVSQLSLSPSAAQQMVFYARRLKAESVTRTFSAIAAILLIGLQFATILAPPTASNAASPNDIIYGGFVSKADLLNHYDSSPELKSLYAYMGISRQDVVNSHVATINSTDRSLISIGRIQHLSSDQKLTVGSYTYWARHLYTWDTGANVTRGSTYEVLEGNRSSDGGFFAVMFACGNIVYKSLPPKPTPPPPPPPPTPKRTPTPTPSAKPTLACVELLGNDKLGSISSGAPLTVSFTGLGSATGQTITQYDFSFGDNTTQSISTSSINHTYSSVGKFVATIRVKGSLGSYSTTPAACTYTVTITPPPAAFLLGKSALNLTQNIDATTKPANASDQIKYILTTKNTGGVPSSYIVVEHLEDVLQYADVTNAGNGILSNGVMTWPASTIAPGATLTESFVVTVKNPIPATPVGVSDKYSYDLRMDNVYGNAVSIAVSPPAPKQIEAAAASLPDTGATTSSLIVLVVCALSIFFYLRNRQLIAEIKMLRGDFQGGR